MIANKFPCSHYKTCAYIGSAHGDLVTQITSAQPHHRRIGFELEEGGPVFNEYIDGNRFSARITFYSGSFFTEDLLGLLCCCHDCRVLSSLEMSAFMSVLH